MPGTKGGWIGVDLDGTLAKSRPHNRELGTHHIGDPVPAMVDKVKKLRDQGWEVRIVTARAIYGRPMELIIEGWCLKHLGFLLPITDRKDFGMVALYDDRAISVAENLGKTVHEIALECGVDDTEFNAALRAGIEG